MRSDPGLLQCVWRRQGWYDGNENKDGKRLLSQYNMRDQKNAG